MKRFACVLILIAAVLAAGCKENTESSPTVISVKPPQSAGEPSDPVGISIAAPESSVPEESSAPTQPNQNEPHFTFDEESELMVPDSAPIRICSLYEALARFDEISNSAPVSDDPNEVVRVLMERNILCFAAMQGKCWTSVNGTGDSPIQSDYIKSAAQMNDLFYGTYTENQAYRLFHPQQAYGYGDLFREEEDGVIWFDMQHLRSYHGDSFSSPTYAAVIESNGYEITFGRYYESTPTAGTSKPNIMHFKAIKENGAWRLQTYITDAEAFVPQYESLITTRRIGAPELMELAKRQVGNIGGEKYWSWYGFGAHMEWCGAFVSWMYNQAGKDGPFFTACDSGGKAWFEERGQWADSDYADIAPGDCIFFDWDLEGSADHVGLVVGTDGVYVYTIEGNRDDVCIARAYSRDFKYILGYGLMEW